MSDENDNSNPVPQAASVPAVPSGADDADAAMTGGGQAAREQEGRDALARQQQDEKDGKSDKKKRYALRNPARFGLHDHGSYMTIRGDQSPGPRNGNQAISDKQLKAMLMMAITEKGWTEIAFYKGYKIDKQLSMRAQSMLAVDAGLAAAMRLCGYERAPNVQMMLKKEPAPFMSNTSKHERNFQNQELAGIRAQISSSKDARKKLGGQFESADGETLYSQLLAQERALRAQMPGTLAQTFSAFAGAGMGAYGAVKSGVMATAAVATFSKDVVVGAGSYLKQGYSALAGQLRARVPEDTFATAPDTTSAAAKDTPKPPENNVA